MSGINSRLIHDSCAQSEKTKTSCAPANYSMFIDNYVSPTLKSSKDIVCLNETKTIGCNQCDTNKNATLELGPQSFVQRADIEDHLRGVKRNLTKCTNQKFMSCEVNAANRIAGECNNVITVNPYLCDRNIVPTNLKFPISKGF
jgi:hypothetical protein